MRGDRVFSSSMNTALPRLLTCCVAFLLIISTNAATHTLGIKGTRFFLNEQPFPYTAISFFNAIYNPALNKSPEDRTK